MSEQESKQPIDVEMIEKHVPESMHPLLEKIIAFRKQLALGIGGLVVLAFIVGAFQWYSANAVEKTNTKLGTILLTETGAAKVDSLEALLKDAPSAIRPAILLELASAAMDTDKYDRAIEAWGELEKSGDDAVKIVAGMGKAKCQILAGKPADAYETLQKVAGMAPESFTVAIYRQLAIAAENKGDKAAALKAWEKLAESGSPDKDFVDYKIRQLKK